MFMKNNKKGKIIDFPQKNFKNSSQTDSPSRFRGDSIFYILAFLCLITLTNTYLLREAQWMTLKGEESTRDLASLQDDKNLEKKLLNRLNSFSSKNIRVRFGKEPTLNDKMAYGEELKGAYVFKYIRNKVLSFQHQNEQIIQLKSFENFITKYKKSWAVSFSSFAIEKKTAKKAVYALFDKKKFKKASMIFELNSKGYLLSLRIDPVSK